MSSPVTLLLDNGSLAPAATLQLRRLARALGERVGAPIAPISLLHSSAVPADQLEGVPAEIFEPAIVRRLADGRTNFLVVPLFFGPSRALSEYVPERVTHLRDKVPDIRVQVAPPLFQQSDARLAQILADHVRAVAPQPGRVALVDHGSPVRVVTAVRDALAGQLSAQLGAGWTVSPASMERRDGPDYDFNEPLLERLLAQSGWRESAVTVAMQFLLPGRHAGPTGDVAQICERVAAEHPQLRTALTPLVAEHPLLVEILADRWRTGQTASSL